MTLETSVTKERVDLTPEDGSVVPPSLVRPDLGFGAALVQSSVVQVLALPIGLLNGILLARLLGPEGRGVLSTIQVGANTLVYFLGFGFAGTATILVGRSSHRIGEIFTLAIWTTVASMLLSAVLLLVPSARQWLGVTSLTTTSLLWCLAGVTVLLSSAKAIAMGLQRFKLINAISFATSVLTLVFNAVVLSVTAGSATAAVLVAVVVPLVAAAAYTSNLVRLLPKFFNPSSGLIREASKIGGRVVATGGLAYLLLRCDVFLLNHYWGKREVGIYSVGVTIAELALLIPSTLNSLLFAKAASRESLSEKIVVATHMTILLGTVFVPAVAIGGPMLFPLIFGRQFAGAAVPAAWVALGAAFWAVASPVTGFAAGKEGYPLSLIMTTAAALAVNVGINLWLIPTQGAVGAAKASACAYSVYALLAFAMFWTSAGLRWRDLISITPFERRSLTCLRIRRVE